MEILTKQREREVTKLLAEEFLEYRLGIKPTKANVQCLVAHIIEFEREAGRYDQEAS